MALGLCDFVEKARNTEGVISSCHFRIKDDNRSEGGESFSIALANPQNAELFSVMSLPVMIEDDEAEEKSRISFEKDSYNSKDGKAVVKIKREGAEYSLCGFTVATEDITALEGENYSAVSGTIALMSYETEKEIPIQGSGDFKVNGEGIVSGFEDNTLRPKANTTHAEAAAILERFIERDSG